MSDLISREALIKELNELWRYVNFDGDKDVFDIIMKAKAIEQGEAVTKLWESLGRWSAYLVSNGEQAELSPPAWLIDAVKNATTPQQTQSVADALEDALTIALEYAQYAHERRQITNRIRALIKRNAKKGE